MINGYYSVDGTKLSALGHPNWQMTLLNIILEYSNYLKIKFYIIFSIVYLVIKSYQSGHNINDVNWTIVKNRW